MPNQRFRTTKLLPRRFRRNPDSSAILPLIIDQVGISAEVAYSLRKLRAAYNGSAIRVRRSFDNGEADIGFNSSGGLDTTALLAHVGVGNGFVVTWYDQSGNSRNVTQSTTGNQPQLVGSGSVLTRNGKPTAVFDNSDALNATMAITPHFVNSVISHATFNAVNTIVRQQNTTSGQAWYLRTNVDRPVGLWGATFMLSPTSMTTGAAILSATASSTNTLMEVFLNGAGIGTQPPWSAMATNGLLAIGESPLGGQKFEGDISELIVFPSNLNLLQRQLLEGNQATYYGINTFLGDFWASGYQINSPTTLTYSLQDNATNDQGTYEEVLGGFEELIGITAVRPYTTSRTFTSYSARVRVTDSCNFTVERWNGTTWVDDIETFQSPPVLSGGVEWVSISGVLDSGVSTTKLRLSISSEGSGINSSIRLGDWRVA